MTGTSRREARPASSSVSSAMSVRSRTTASTEAATMMAMTNMAPISAVPWSSIGSRLTGSASEKAPTAQTGISQRAMRGRWPRSKGWSASATRRSVRRRRQTASRKARTGSRKAGARAQPGASGKAARPITAKRQA